MANIAAKRIKREFMELPQTENEPNKLFHIEPVDNNLLNLTGYVIGPSESLFEGGRFKVEIKSMCQMYIMFIFFHHSFFIIKFQKRIHLIHQKYVLRQKFGIQIYVSCIRKKTQQQQQKLIIKIFNQLPLLEPFV